MKNSLLRFAFAVLLAIPGAFAENTGSSESAAEVLPTPTTSESTYSVSLTPAYDAASGGYSSYGVYYYKIPLVKGNDYTIWVTDNGRISYELIKGTDSRVRSSFMSYSVGSSSWKMIRAGEWNAADDSTCFFYVYFIASKTSGSAGVLHVQKTASVVPGTASNPAVVTMPTSGMVTNTFKIQGSTSGYFLTANLTQGRQYRFATSFGTAENVASLSVNSSAADKVQGFTEGFNGGFDIVAGRTGAYVLVAGGSRLSGGFGAISLAYGLSEAPMTDRAPADHTLAGTLTDGVRKTCKPGYRLDPKLEFTDQVIDECLFSFAAAAGRRYAVVTDAATVPLVAEIYDASGKVLASGTLTGDGSHDALAAFSCPADGTYYVGVCEDLETAGVSAPRYLTVGVTLRALGEEVRNDVLLTPALTGSAGAGPIGLDQGEQAASCLATDTWQNVFRIAGQAGMAYRLRIETVNGVTPAVGVKAAVFKTSTLTGTEVAASGSVSPDDTFSSYLEFLADENAFYYIRIASAGGNGVSFPPYRLRSCVYSSDAASLGAMTVTSKGVSADDAVVWSTGSGLSYPCGVTVYVTSPQTVSFSDVSGRSTPEPIVASEFPAVLTGVYCDSWDHGDDELSGAVQIDVGDAFATNATHSLLHVAEGPGGDPADWYVLQAQPGRYYEFRLVDVTGHPAVTVYDAATNVLDYGESLSVFSVQKAGPCYVKVSYSELQGTEDSTYRLACRSLETGTVAFESAAVTCGETCGKVSLTVRRTTSAGRVRVRWGTVAGTATAGRDYHAASGVLDFADGGALAQTISIDIIPDALPVSEGPETFSVSLVPVDEADMDEGEYSALIAAPAVATVTIEDGGTVPVPEPVDTSDSPDVESALTSLADGSFAGVLRELDGACPDRAAADLAKVVSLTSDDGTFSATVDVAGTTYVLSGVASAAESGSSLFVELTNDVARLWLAFPAGTAADLDDAVPQPVLSEFELTLRDEDGVFVDAVSYAGRIFRLDNAKHAVSKRRLKPYVGRYTVALDDFGGDGTGSGCLSLAVAVDGKVTGTCVTPGGETLPFDADAFASVADIDGETTVCVPLRLLSENALLGGTLLLRQTAGTDDPVAVAEDAESGLVWNDDSILDEYALVVRHVLSPLGGAYDTVSDFGGLFADRDLLEATGLKDVRLTNESLSGAEGSYDLRLDRATGVLSGTIDGQTARGVILTAVPEEGNETVVAAGTIATGTGDSRGFRVLSVPTSRDETEDWGFFSLVTFDGAGAAAGTPEALSLQTGDVFTLPVPDLEVFVRTGYAFVGWMTPTGLATAGTDYPVPASNCTMTAQWKLDGVDRVLGCPGAPLMFDTTGAADWAVAPGEGPAGADAMRSGEIGKSQRSVLTATATGSGYFTFTWSCSCDAVKYCWAAFTVTRGGETVEVARIGGTTDWTSVGCDVVAGDVLAWTYEKGSSARVAGDDRVRLASCSWKLKSTVSFEPGADCRTDLTNRVCFAGEPFGDLPTDADGSAEWTDHSLDHWYWVDGVRTNRVTRETLVPSNDVTLVAALVDRQFYVNFQDADGSALCAPRGGVKGATITLPTADDVTKTGYRLTGWTIGDAVRAPGASYVIPGGSNVVMTAGWSLDGVDRVLGCPGAPLMFDTTGVADWAVAPGEGPAGADAMRSGEIGKSQRSVLTATATGSGYFTFTWSSSCDAVKYCWAAFTVTRGGETVEVARIGGTTDWTSVGYDVVAGDVLAWTYEKGSSAYVAGDDRVRLASCSWKLKSTVSFEPGADCRTDLTNRVCFAGEPFGDLPTDADGSAEWTDHSLDYWYWVDGVRTNRVTRETLVPSNDVTLVAALVDRQFYVNFQDADGSALCAPRGGVKGATITLPTADDVTKAGYLLTGWLSAGETFGPGADYTIPGGSNVVLTAAWKTDFAAALGCSGADIAFSTSGTLDWFVAEDPLSEMASGLIVQSGWIGGGGSSVFRAEIGEAGTLSVDWRISCDADKYAGCSLYTNDVLAARLSGLTDHLAWETLGGWHFNAGDVLEWRFTKASNARTKPHTGAGEDRVCLQQLLWTPDKKKTLPFEIVCGENVSSVTWTLDGVEQSGLTAELEDGQVLVLTKVCYAVGYRGAGTYVKGYSQTLECASCGRGLRWNVEAQKVSAPGDLPADVTPEEAGIVSGEFARAGTTPAEVKKVVGWAVANGAQSAVNGIEFTDGEHGRVPANDAAAAYLLNCAPEGLDAARKAFAIPSISQAGDGSWVVGEPVGTFNGTVKTLKATAPSGPWSEATPDASGHLFFRATLVK